MTEKWWKNGPEVKNCVKEDFKSSDGVSIANFGGVFIVIFIGVGLACIGLAFEYWWYKHRKGNQKICDITTEQTKATNSEQIKHVTDPDMNVSRRRRGNIKVNRDCMTAKNTNSERMHKAWVGRSIQSS